MQTLKQPTLKELRNLIGSNYTMTIGSNADQFTPADALSIIADDFKLDKDFVQQYENNIKLEHIESILEKYDDYDVYKISIK